MGIPTCGTEAINSGNAAIVRPPPKIDILWKLPMGQGVTVRVEGGAWKPRPLESGVPRNEGSFCGESVL